MDQEKCPPLSRRSFIQLSGLVCTAATLQLPTAAQAAASAMAAAPAHSRAFEGWAINALPH